MEMYLLLRARVGERLEIELAANALFLAVANASRTAIDEVVDEDLLRREVERRVFRLKALELAGCAFDANALLDWLSKLAIAGISSEEATAMLYISKVSLWSRE